MRIDRPDGTGSRPRQTRADVHPVTPTATPDAHHSPPRPKASPPRTDPITPSPTLTPQNQNVRQQNAAGTRTPPAPERRRHQNAAGTSRPQRARSPCIESSDIVQLVVVAIRLRSRQREDTPANETPGVSTPVRPASQSARASRRRRAPINTRPLSAETAPTAVQRVQYTLRPHQSVQLHNRRFFTTEPYNCTLFSYAARRAYTLITCNNRDSAFLNHGTSSRFCLP